MSVFTVNFLLGVLALFLCGMTMMSDGLERVSGGRLETVLERMKGVDATVRQWRSFWIP